MNNPEKSRGKKTPEYEMRRVLSIDEYISSLVSKVNGLKESDSDGYVQFVGRDVSILASFFDRLAENPGYEPSTDELKDPRVRQVWESSIGMRNAMTDPQDLNQVKVGYGYAVDKLVSGAAKAISSRASRDTSSSEVHQIQPAPTTQPAVPSQLGGPTQPGGSANDEQLKAAAAALPELSGQGTSAPTDEQLKAAAAALPEQPGGSEAKGQGDDNDIEVLNRRDELLRELVEILNRPSTSEAEEARAAELAKELNEMLGLSDDDAETGGTPTPVNPGGNPSPVAPVPRRRAHQTRPSSPQPGGGTPGGPGRPGTPPPASPIPPSSPEGRPRPVPQTPDHDAGQPKTLEEEERELEERLAKIREERNAPYAAKLDAYAELLAKEESKRADGGFRFSIMHWVGGPGNNRKRERRREALDEAGKALKKEVLAYLRQKVETKRQKGEYQGTDDEIAQQMSDEMFDEQRKIFGQRLQERKDEILRSESDKLRNRILAKIGSWIGMEKSTKNSLKAAAVGVGHGLVKGAAVGALTGLFGVTWPISVGVSIVAATIGDRMIRRGIRLDAIRQGLGGQNGSRQLVDDDKFARIKEKAEGKKHSQEFMADKMLKLSRKDSYAAGDRLSKETNERLNKHKVALGIGRLAGGAVGGLGGRWVGQQLHDHTPVGQAVDSAKRNVHEFIHREDTAAAAEREYQGKIDELNRRIDELNNRLEQATAASNIDNSGSFSNWEYPWDWAVDQFGENNAISKLYELADAAARDGHNIQWHGYGDTQWLSIDGKSDTATVLETLAKYMKDDYGLAA